MSRGSKEDLRVRGMSLSARFSLLMSSALAVVNGASSDDAPFADAKLHTANFYARHVMPRTAAYASAAEAGSAALMELPEAGF